MAQANRIYKLEKANVKTSTENDCQAWHHGSAAEILSLRAISFHVATGLCPGCSASHPAPCLWPGRAVEDGPKPWDLQPTWETPGSWLWVVSALAVLALCGMNQQMENFSVFLHKSYLSNKNKS